MMRMLVADAVVSDDHLHAPGWVSVVGTRIRAVGAGTPPDTAGESVEHVPGTLVPGFVDIHTHGAAGTDFSAAVEGSVDAALQLHRRRGTTTMIASLATAPLDLLERQVSALAEHVRDGTLGGIHLEGPWLSPGHRGAHAASLLRAPARAEVERILSLTGAVRMVTIAPELPGGIDAIRSIVNSGAVAAIGHTSGTATDARAAFDAGATVATHLFNGMPALHSREPGPVAAALLDERVFVELILDGRHLAAETVDLVIRQARERIIAVSDSIAATGCADGDYILAGTAVRVLDGVATTVDTGSLAGSTRTLDTAFRTLVQQHGLSLPQAAAATSATPARAVGLRDVGRIAPGMTADLVLLHDLAVSAVMRRGDWLVGP